MPISEVVNLILHYSDHVSSMIANMDSGHKVELCETVLQNDLSEHALGLVNVTAAGRYSTQNLPTTRSSNKFS